MFSLLVAFFISLIGTLVVIHFATAHGHRSLDHDLSGPQKFHARPVPRVGGIGIALGVTLSVGVAYLMSDSMARLGAAVLLCSAPAFVAGVAEDITKAQSPRRRLFFTAVSAAVAAWLLGATIRHSSIPGLDWLLSFLPVAVAVTIFAVAGVANAVNIIDGLNGLASMCGMLILGSIAYVAYQSGDADLCVLCLAVIGSVLGFFVWNFPAGLIFLGDGGAYFLGFIIAEAAILLLNRNPGVSPMFPLLACIYPIFETLFSIYRRRFIRALPPSMPDGIHLHSLIYRRLMRWAVGNREAKALTRRNSMTSPYLWVVCMCSLVPGVIFWDNTPVLAGFIALFALGYVVMYWRIVRFKTPRWMVYRR